MVIPSGVNVIKLTRDNTSTPWGFRLQGGKETNTPLSVQRVFAGSVSEGKLHRGDIVVDIEGHDALNMYHSQADNFIRGSGRQMNISVRRGDEYQNGVQSPGSQPPWRTSSGPQSPQYGSSSGGSYPGSYPSGGRSQSGAGDEDEDYSKSVGEIRQMFNKPTVQQTYRGLRLDAEPGSTSYVPKRPTFQKPRGTYTDIVEPGWIPRNKPSPHTQDRYAPATMRSPPINRQGNDLQNYRPPPPVIYREPPEKPAWLGSLRSSGGPKHWELQEQDALLGGSGRARSPPAQNQQTSAPVMSQTYPGPGGRRGGGGGAAREGRESPVIVHNPKVQSFRYGPGSDGPLYEQRDAGSAVDSDSARVAHLQYNSPIGLYSKQNALDVLKGQTHGKPGEGTLQITGGGSNKQFNPNEQSSVYRMIQEEEEQQRRGGNQGGRPVSSGGAAPARRPVRRPSPPRQSEEQHSARFNQLVNENSDQMDEYMRSPHHSTAYPSSYGSTRGGVPSSGGRSIPVGHDAGISDF